MAINASNIDYTELLNKTLSSNATYKLLEGENPFRIELNGFLYNLFIKPTTSAYFEYDKDRTRAQLPSHPSFEQMKKEKKPFIFLGYDIDNQVFSTWEPEWVKARLNEMERVSFYSKFSIQQYGSKNFQIRHFSLRNDAVVYVFPRNYLSFVLRDIQKYYPTTYLQTVTETEEEQVAENKESDKQIDSMVSAVREPIIGKITTITDINLLAKLKPLMLADNRFEALDVLDEFYGDCPDMDLTDWYHLLDSINWKRLNFNNRCKVRLLKIILEDGKVISTDNNRSVLTNFLNTVARSDESMYAIQEQTNGILFKMIPNNSNDSRYKILDNKWIVDTFGSSTDIERKIKQIASALHLQIKIEIN